MANLAESERDALRAIDYCYNCLTKEQEKGVKLMLLIYSLQGLTWLYIT